MQPLLYLFKVDVFTDMRSHFSSLALCARAFARIYHGIFLAITSAALVEIVLQALAIRMMTVLYADSGVYLFSYGVKALSAHTGQAYGVAYSTITVGNSLLACSLAPQTSGRVTSWQSVRCTFVSTCTIRVSFVPIMTLRYRAFFSHGDVDFFEKSFFTYFFPAS